VAASEIHVHPGCRQPVRHAPIFADAFLQHLDNPLTLRSIYNAVEVGIITAVVGGALAFAIGYTIHRTTSGAGAASIWCRPCRWRFRASWWASPICGLDRHSRRALRHLWILALAFIARFMPDTVKALSTSVPANPSRA